jgi:stage II sporulation protein AA (anti-sigma F factor antagonist)
MRVQRRGAELVVRLAGDLDLTSADEIRTVLDQYIDAGCRHLVLHMQEVTFIDSSGLGVLLGRLRRLEPLGGHMTVVRPSPHIRRLLEFSGLKGLLSFAEREEVGGRGERRKLL